MSYDSIKFWKIKEYTHPLTIASMYERLDELKKNFKIFQNLPNPKQRIRENQLEYANILTGQQIIRNQLILNEEHKESDMENTVSSYGYSEDMTDEANEIIKMLNNESQLKLLQMYFDSYMAPKNSDIQWRLGPVTGTVLNTDFMDNDLSMIENGAMYTRSNFSIPYFRKFLVNGEISDKEERFTSLFFPPYKIGEKTGISDRTAFMRNVLKENPNASFNQDTFMLTRDGFTYRDPGYKSISDYISFLQWVIEGCTGIVSTYLTEWDLSVYMQEGLMTPKINGGASPIYLNYRIRKDNPIATEDGRYTDDRALCYNVTGSAVSKFEHANQKVWRPSDYPLSQWWIPYRKNVHWKMKNIRIDEEVGNEERFNFLIPYMDIYDNVNSSFSYEGQQLKDILKQQDFLGYVLGTWPNETLKYYRAFYRTDGDNYTDFDVTENTWLKKVAGANKGESAKEKKTMNDFITKAREEMLLNGGYYGGPTQPGDTGGWMQRGAISAALNSEKTQISQADEDLEDAGFDQVESGTSSELTEHSVLQDTLNQTVDASNMCSYKGVNRFSPAIFGGPHGADYSPNSIHGYFDDTSTILRNIPRVSDNNAINFSSYDENDYFSDLNKFYDDNSRRGCSPSKSISKLVKGDPGYYWDYGYTTQTKTQLIRGKIEFDYVKRTWTNYQFPTHTETGQPITYYGDNIVFKNETYTRSLIPWNEDDWWYDWTAYWNPANTSFASYYFFFYRYITISKTPYRLGSYKYTGMQSFKNIFFDDEPDVKWQIVHHDFPDDKHIARNERRDSSPKTDFWTKITTQKYSHYFVENNPWVKSEYPEHRFVLKFYGSTSTEHRIMNNLVQRLKGNEKASLVFLEGNLSGRYKNGPDSMFRAPVDVDYYTNAITRKLKLKILFWTITIDLSPQFVFVPFINVHLYDTVWFEDNLQLNAKNNKSFSGSDYPLHLKNAITQETIAYFDNPVQKFTNSCNDIIVSSRTDVVSSGNIFDVLFNNTSGSSTDGINWISQARMGLSGIGILSSIQGTNPEAENIIANNGIVEGNFNYRDYMTLSSDAKTYAFTKVPFKFHRMTSFESAKEMSYTSNKQSWTKGPMPKYVEFEADDGFKYAMGKIFTRAKFFPDTIDMPPAAYITIDTPIRNFLSICLTQVSYLEFARDAILESASFEVLNNALRECVDKCVIKANGMDYSGNLVEPDRHHVLYNYWMEQAVKLFGTKENFIKYKEQIQTEINRKITKFEYVIDRLSKICAVDILEWTFNDYEQCINLIASMKEETKLSIFDKFLFAYVNILYNYRFYFIARRFNKESGTMWIMRALESVLDLMQNENNPPPSPRRLKNTAPNYKVSFYELNNTSSMKHDALLSDGDIILSEDRVTTLYVKINWATEEQYNEYIKFKENQSKENEKPEVVIVYKNGIKKYAFKPVDGLYRFMSNEIKENDKNKNWNELHPKETQRLVNDFDDSIFNIQWGDSPDLTPIRWDVFGTINVSNLLEYGKYSISPEDLLCLIEEGADFWTVKIPPSEWPRAEGYKTKLFLKTHVVEKEVSNEDPYVTLLGPLAYQIYPITLDQERPQPGIALSNPKTWTDLTSGTKGF